jgi:hypothetical protein
VIPVHYEGWWHFRESVEHVKARFAAGGIADRVLWLAPGDATHLVRQGPLAGAASGAR